ncbi:helix-turn-helix domain-containing protein [Bacillus sp. FSL K6-3431]|uniref:helix-turn-helix domain-containing protein n=1 Tax=Bacillus sp. FSL K6-3431 TaxID=2921500 RepID=UPI0030FB1F8E
MSKVREYNNLGLLLKELLNKHSMSMRKLSELTEIDTATISRIINGKRKANLQHLKRFSECLGVPLTTLFEAAGYPLEQKQEKSHTDIHKSIEIIQNFLESYDLYDKEFTIVSVDQQLNNYGQYSQTEKGKNIILKSFNEKLVKVGAIGPFISQLKELYEKFRLRKGTPHELVIIGSALLFFIIPVDVIPDYIFPIGYIDDAIAVQIVLNLLSE